MIISCGNFFSVSYVCYDHGSAAARVGSISELSLTTEPPALHRLICEYCARVHISRGYLSSGGQAKCTYRGRRWVVAVIPQLTFGIVSPTSYRASFYRTGMIASSCHAGSCGNAVFYLGYGLIHRYCTDTGIVDSIGGAYEYWI
jgi:hypothetical protein